MARDVEHVVDASGDTEVATVGAAHRAVASQVHGAAHFLREVALFEALRVVPDGADHRRPGALDDQNAAGAVGNVVAHFVHDGGHDAGQRQSAASGHQGRGARQRRHHVAAGFGLPEGVHDGALFMADVLVVPHPGFGVDGLAHRTEDAQAAQVRTVWVHRGVALGGLDQRADGCGRGVEDRALVALDHLPEASGVGESRHAFKNDLRGACGQGAVGHIGVAGNPADVGRAPEHVIGLQIKSPVHGQLGPQQVAAGRVLHALGLAGRARCVKNKERMLGAHGHRRAHGALAFDGLGKCLVATGHHIASAGSALVDVHGLDRLAAAHGQAFVHDGFKGQLFAAAHLEVGGDDRHGTGVNDALLQRLG